MKKDKLIAPELEESFWLVSADMGYGHQRAIYPLKKLAAEGRIINVNNLPNASRKELKLWKDTQRAYEYISRAGNLPLIGRYIKKLLDSLLHIPSYYPISDRSKPTMQVKYLKILINRGLCKSLTDKIINPELPLITSFYTSAIAADIAGHKKIYCIICDTDINRVWVPEKATNTNIIYFASGSVSAQRLQSYGVAENNILITGFPLPIELLGDHNLSTLKKNLLERLDNLDPSSSFKRLYNHSLAAILKSNLTADQTLKLKKKFITITFAVGGAGAQKEIGRQIAKSLAEKISRDEIKLNLVAGTRPELRDYFEVVMSEFGRNKNIEVIWSQDTESYFDLFNNCLHTTDVLWTKPSELSFYCALGIPIIMTPAIGPQEKCNQRWLIDIGAGIKQRNPEYTDQWLYDLLKNGRLAEAAWNGFLKARKYGSFNILEFLGKGHFQFSNDPLKR